MKLIPLIFGTLIIASLIYLSIIFWPQNSPTEKYIIKWCAVKTGATGQGTIGFSKEEAEAIAKELNLEHKELLHWLEEYPEEHLGR